MTGIAPIVMTWQDAEVIDPTDGTVERRKVMVPAAAYRRKAEAQYQDAANYTLAPVEARSRAAHNRYFAALNDAFSNLPETISARWQNADHFRKWILIEVNEYREKDFTFEGRNAKQQADALAIHFRVDGEDYARVWVTQVGPEKWKVIARWAKSQDHQSMNKVDFKATSDKVVEYAENLLGTPRGTLMREAGRSA